MDRPPMPTADEVRKYRDDHECSLQEALKVLRNLRRKLWLNDMNAALSWLDGPTASKRVMFNLIDYLMEEFDD